MFAMRALDPTVTLWSAALRISEIPSAESPFSTPMETLPLKATWRMRARFVSSVMRTCAHASAVQPAAVSWAISSDVSAR
jgi:hypothetical protein